MPYIGKQPDFNTVGTDELTDNAVTNAKIVDDISFTSITGSVVSASIAIVAGVYSGGVMSGSGQTAINLPRGVVSSSAQLMSGSVGVMSGSAQTAINLPRGVVSSSAQLMSGSVGVMSGSAQTKANLPTGTVSASMGISGSAKSTASFAQILVGGSDGSNVFAVISGSGASGVVRISGSIHSTGSFGALKTGDLELENKRGHWKIVEESEYLSITNVNTNKKYKFVLEEIE